MTRMMKGLLPATLAVCLLLVSGCGATATPTATPTRAVPPTAERPEPAEPRVPEEMPTQLIEKARADLMSRLGLAASAITGAAVTQPVVPEDNLGCPLSSTSPTEGKKLQPGAPGTRTVYEVRLITAGGIHVYRIDGERVVYCGSL